MIGLHPELIVSEATMAVSVTGRATALSGLRNAVIEEVGDLYGKLPRAMLEAFAELTDTHPRRPRRNHGAVIWFNREGM